ncbi:MAG TPA: hypothetical protein VGA33_12190, partial [Thermoanaerobaculia bacterium]
MKSFFKDLIAHLLVGRPPPSAAHQCSQLGDDRLLSLAASEDQAGDRDQQQWRDGEKCVICQ